LFLVVGTRAVPNILFVFYSVANSGQNALFVFGSTEDPKLAEYEYLALLDQHGHKRKS